MRIKKIITGVLIASTLSLSVPAIAVAEPEGGHGPFGFTWLIGAAAVGLVVWGAIDASRSP